MFVCRKDGDTLRVLLEKGVGTSLQGLYFIHFLVRPGEVLVDVVVDVNLSTIIENGRLEETQI